MGGKGRTGGRNTHEVKWTGCGAARVGGRCPGPGLGLGMKTLRPVWDTLNVRTQGRI